MQLSTTSPLLQKALGARGFRCATRFTLSGLILSVLSVSLWAPLPAQAGFSLFDGNTAHVAVVGVRGALRDNVLAYLEPLESTLVSLDVDRPRVVKSVETALSALGYFHPEIHITEFDKPKKEGGPRPLLVTIKAAPPVLLKEVNVKIVGPGASFPPFVEALKKVPVVGDVLNQGTYENFKSELNAIALTYGFFDAHFLIHQLGVAKALNEGTWNIVFDTGERWKFGSLKIEGSELVPELVKSLEPFKAGDDYDASSVNLFNRNLAQTGWFASALVAPETDAADDKTHTLPMLATLEMQKKNSMDIGLGVSSDVGMHGKLNWNKPWINRYGHSFSSQTEVSRPEQTQNFTYRVPVKRSPLTDYWIYQAGVKHQRLNDTNQTRWTLGISRFHTTSNNWKLSANLRYSLNNFTQANEHVRSRLLMPGVSASRTRSEGGLAPHWGDTQRYSVDFSLNKLLSDTSFTRIKLENAWLRTYQKKHRIFIRGTLGMIATRNFDVIPPDLRFFAGGDNSVRGYDYQSISPKNAQGQLTGARLLATASFEYRYNVTGQWWASTFIDMGDAVNSFKKFGPKKGAGVGIRWISPVGPIKFDIARPIGGHVHEKRPWKFYIGLGSEL